MKTVGLREMTDEAWTNADNADGLRGGEDAQQIKLSKGWILPPVGSKERTDVSQDYAYSSAEHTRQWILVSLFVALFPALYT